MAEWAGAVGSVAAASVDLYNTNIAADNSDLLRTIENKARQQSVMPFLKREKGGYIITPLMNLLFSSYKPITKGFSQVVYAPPSYGKTTSARAFLEFKLAPKGAPGLMFTSPTRTDYFGSLARSLDAGDRAPACLVCLVVALENACINSGKSGVLILDEFDHSGYADENINLVELLMRYISIQKCHFQLYIITQKISIANTLCALNGWQKIGPLQGLTEPSRDAVAEDRNVLLTGLDDAESFSWNTEFLEWTKKLLTKLILLHFENARANFPQHFDEDGLLLFVTNGMTPTSALERAGVNFSEEELVAGEVGDVLTFSED